MIGAWICTIALSVFSSWALFGKTQPTPPRRDFGDVELSARVRRLTQTQQRIDTLDQMITDLEMCDPGEYHRNFRFDWQSGDENRTFEFWADGDNNTTEDLLFLARRERQKLKRSLLDQIDALK